MKINFYYTNSQIDTETVSDNPVIPNYNKLTVKNIKLENQRLDHAKNFWETSFENQILTIPNGEDEDSFWYNLSAKEYYAGEPLILLATHEVKTWYTYEYLLHYYSNLSTLHKLIPEHFL